MRWKKWWKWKRKEKKIAKSLLIRKHNKFLITSFGKLIWWYYFSHSLESWSLSRHLFTHTPTSCNLNRKNESRGKNKRTKKIRKKEKVCGALWNIYVSEEMEIYLSEKLENAKGMKWTKNDLRMVKFMWLEVLTSRSGKLLSQVSGKGNKEKKHSNKVVWNYRWIVFSWFYRGQILKNDFTCIFIHSSTIERKRAIN